MHKGRSTGLVKLISLHSITKLVMGAAADQHYSREMNTPKSLTALKLMETAAPSCKIWFTCKGHLICTREENENLPAIPPSPEESTVPLLPAGSISNQMRSTALPELEYEVSSSKGCTSSSLVATEMTTWDYFFGDWGMRVYGSSKTEDAQSLVTDGTNELTPVKHSLTHESGNVYFLQASASNQEDKPSVDVEMCDNLQHLCNEAKLLDDEPDEESKKLHKAETDLLSALQRIKELEGSYLHEVGQREETEKMFSKQRLKTDELRRQRYTLSDELQDSNKHKLILEQRINQIKSSAKDHVEEITKHFLKQSHEESKKHRKIEMDLLSTLQRVKEIESLFQNERAQRKEMEEKVARQRTEIEETKRERDKLYYDLHDVKEQKLQLEVTDASKEIDRRRKAERDLLSALQRIKDLEHQHIHEVEKRDEMQEIVARQEEEIKATKRQLQGIHDRIMIEMKSAVKVHEEKLADTKQFLQELQSKYEKLLHDRDAAVAEAKELRQKNKQRGSMTNEPLNTEFSFAELQQATKGFDAEFKISDDGFASIYKGFLRNTTVAIKLFHPQSLTGQAKFHREVAVLSRVRHPNLITLIGACPNHFTLVYEFLPNGSVEDRLSCKKNMPSLTWKVRTRIIGEICSALAFIHSQKPYPIVHGDLNLANILLDANFVSKLGDLGICQFLSQSNITTINQQRHPTNHRGTLCYMDSDEFQSACELMLWSDVHSFGIIILRLLTGRSQHRIAGIVEEAMEKGNLHSIMDTSAGDWPLVQAKQLAHLGLRCITMSGGRQPDLGGEAWEVIEVLMRDACLTAGPSEFASSSNDDSTPSCFICPIFQEVMNDPYIAADGFTYEATAIKEWLDSGADTSPMTNLRLAHRGLTPNRALRSAILEWQQHWK
ncbi:U-box domain-containing protein 33-like isoform X2 [Panicum hallii]|uniref:U-box domain-containing protein 33-like isoform X2 n=1 Tax=Panicum hallii TaxID=206008 RepID=UPI000DF4D08C|nr:U-box domain-containing protein 33-like isoform X2 [Panicum hallii]